MKERVLITGIIVLLIGIGLIAVFREKNVEGKVIVYLQNPESGEYKKAGEKACVVSDKNLTFTPSEKSHYEIDYDRSMLQTKSDKNVVFAVYYKCKTVTVVFSGEGGVLVSGAETLTLRAGQSFEMPIYTKEGHLLVGFKNKNSASDVPSTDNKVFENTEFVAIWKPIDSAA